MVTVQPGAPAVEERCRQVEERGQQLQMMASMEEELERQQLADRLGRMEAVQEQHEKVVAELRTPLQDCQTQLEQIGGL